MQKDSSLTRAISPKNGVCIYGAKTHNLKNINAFFPRNKFIVVTGVSGSGKSSLTIDTLFAEGQRKYAESLSAYARQFVAKMQKPEVDYIQGLSPAIAIEQKVITQTSRSTVGSMTEIYDYLRLFYAKIGKTYSPISGQEVKKDSVDSVVNELNTYPEKTKIYILYRFPNKDYDNLNESLNLLLQKGFSRILLQDSRTDKKEITPIEDYLAQPLPTKNKSIFVMVDRFIKSDWEEADFHRIADSLDIAFFEGEGEIYILVNEATLLHFNNKFELDGILFEPPQPNLFSFNNSFGACPSCEGFGQTIDINPDLVIPDKSLSLYEGAIAPWKGEKMGLWKDYFIKYAPDFPMHTPIQNLSPEHYEQLWKGVGKAEGIDAFFDDVSRNLYKVQYRVLQSRYRGKTICRTCGGARLRKEALYIKINDKSIADLVTMQCSDLKIWLDNIVLTDYEQELTHRIRIELYQRIATLIDVGLGYLSLDRLANTLSGGESQRIQLTRSLGSPLTDALYILDEPSIGLHSRDTERLVGVLQALKNKGNTIIVVEHDEMIMRAADYIIDMGPKAAHLGGEIIATGNYEEIINNPNSLTGKYLSGELQVYQPTQKRNAEHYITIESARLHNLKNISVAFPLNLLCVVCGVSGSGKTTLVKDVLYPELEKYLETKQLNAKRLRGDLDRVNHIEMIDQNPIGKSSRSNPVTYIKAFDEIRYLMATQPLSKIRGYLPKHFSFNVTGGRCEVCQGEGEQMVEMQFLANVHLVCETCKGKRFKEEVLEVVFNHKSIYDILSLSVDEAINFFDADKTSKPIANLLKPLQDVGLGYIKLGQSSNTLSGGEAQRVKLASFLGKGNSDEKILFIFDEPTTGLHFNDISKLLSSFERLLKKGHSIIVIEHNNDIIRAADWIIELGPEGGKNGGNIVYQGLPKE